VALLADEEILVTRDGDALIVSSPADKGNFLFRVPKGFERADAAEPPALFRATRPVEGGGGHAEIRLDRREATDLDTEAKSAAETLAKGLEEPKPAAVSGSGARRVVTVEGRSGDAAVRRSILLARDGSRTYALLVSSSPPDDALAAVLQGFTLLAVREAEGAPPPSPDLAEKRLEHDFYRLALLKPAGFESQVVDPDGDRGIVYRFKRRDAVGNQCSVSVRALRGRTNPQPLEEMAKAAITRFTGTATEVKAPKSPPRATLAGAKEGFRVKMSGRLAGSGLVLQEEVLLVDHGNGWVYEVQLTTYGGAAKEFAKEIKAFWTSLRFRDTP